MHHSAAHHPAGRLHESRALPAQPAAVSTARSFVAETCQRWGVNDLTECATLVTSELVTNAVIHVRSDVHIWLDLDEHVLTVAVRDDSPRSLPKPTVSADLEHGRGLLLVDLLSRDWGVHPHGAAGKTVWAALPRR